MVEKNSGEEHCVLIEKNGGDEHCILVEKSSVEMSIVYWLRKTDRSSWNQPSQNTFCVVSLFPQELKEMKIKIPNQGFCFSCSVDFSFNLGYCLHW